MSKKHTSSTPAGVPRSRASKTKRARYCEKWNGPNWRIERRGIAARRAHGCESTRVSATAYWCRLHGWFPETYQELHRMAGVGGYNA